MEIKTLMGFRTTKVDDWYKANKRKTIKREDFKIKTDPDAYRKKKVVSPQLPEAFIDKKIKLRTVSPVEYCEMSLNSKERVNQVNPYA